MDNVRFLLQMFLIFFGTVSFHFWKIFVSVCFIVELVQTATKGLVYNGDVDMALNFLADEWFVDGLGINPVSDYKEWHIPSGRIR